MSVSLPENKMRSCRVIIVLIIFIFASSAVAQSKYPSLLWKVSSKDASKPSYLYGTMHSFDKRVFKFTDMAEKYIKEVDVFASEIELDFSKLDMFTKLLPYIMFGGDTTIKTLLDSGRYAALDKYFADSVGLPLTFLAKIKPFYLMALLSQGEMTQDSGTFLDSHLSNKAKEFGKEVTGLETVDEQLQAVNGIPLLEQMHMLEEAIDSLYVPSVNDADEMTTLYEHADLEGLYNYFQKEETSGEFNESLITIRNKRMADRFEDYVKKGRRLFAAVGALHLPGERGVIELLRAKGFSVTPIILTH